MARTIDEVMNRELFTVRADERASLTRETLLALGIGAAPVVDDAHRPIGMVWLRDLLHEGLVKDRMKPACTVSVDERIEAAGRALTEGDVHDVVAIDREGRVAGMVSCLDVMRGLLGIPARHPRTFPHYDARLDVFWTDDEPLGVAHLDEAPTGGGVFLLIRGGVGRTESVVWAEASTSVRARLEQIATQPDAQDPALKSALGLPGSFRFRAAAVEDAARRASIVAWIRDELGRAHPAAITA